MNLISRGSPDEIRADIAEQEELLRRFPPKDDCDLQLRKLHTLREHLAEAIEYDRIRVSIHARTSATKKEEN